jgi:NAD dependent epimerase/dehydratase family enzyme
VAGTDALAGVCHEWEKAFHTVQLPKTRKAILRIGFVLGREGGAFPILMRLTRWFLGGAAGGGRQYIRWIHLADEKLSGTFNAVTPEAVTNAEFMRELRRVMHRPWCPPAPEFMVRLVARFTESDPSLALTSQRCVPRRFTDAGFLFRFSRLDAALRDLCKNQSS